MSETIDTNRVTTESDGVKSAAHYCVPRGRYKIADGRVIDCCLCANYHELIIPAEVPAGE